MTWLVLITILWLLAEGADPKASRYSLSQNGNSNINTPCKIGLILTLTLMVGFWGLVAQDHPLYVKVYNLFHNYSLSDQFNSIIALLGRQAIGMELGYNVINILGNYMNLKAPLFLMLTALFVNICVVKFIYDYPHPVLSLFFILSMNFFLQEANLVRQILAMSIFLLSITPLLEGKWKLYLLLIFVATLFHTSAIILSILAIFEFVRTKNTRAIAFYSLIGMWVISILFMLGIISFSVASIFIDTSYSIYAVDKNGVGMEVSFMNIAFHNIVAIALLFCYKQLNIKSKIFYYAVVLITVSCINISYAFPNFFRFATYFSVIFFVFVIYIFSKSKKWHLGVYSIPIIMLQIYCGLRLLLFFIIEENVFGSQSYSLSDFF